MVPETESRIGLTLPDGMEFDAWLAFGKDLASQSRQQQWLVADWAAFGFDRFPEQVKLALPEITPDPERLKRMADAARKFSLEDRTGGESIELAMLAAKLPHGEGKRLLSDWTKGNKTLHDAKFEAIERQQELGLISPASEVDEDWDYRALKTIAAAWNRAPKHIRNEFADLVEDSDLAVIEV